MSADNTYTSEELIICCIAREIKDGNILVEGINTTLPTAAYLLAKLTHAPRANFLCLAGNVYVDDPLKLSFALEEEEAVRYAVGFQSSVIPPLYTTFKHDFEMLRSAQIDKYGNVNSTVIGDYSVPKVRLPGISGVLDVFGLCDHVKLYFPRHTKRIFVERVDFVSALGNGDGDPEARSGLLGNGPYMVITNLGIFGFDQDAKAMKLVSIHPSVTLEHIRENTGFDVLISERTTTTPPPSASEVNLIRTKIDPFGLRDIESGSGPGRLELIRGILEKERELIKRDSWKALIN